MADFDLLLEAERRGILPEDKAGLLAEARRRGIAPPALEGAAASAQAQPDIPEAQTMPLIPTSRQELRQFGQTLYGLGKGVQDIPIGITQLGLRGAEALTGSESVKRTRESFDRFTQGLEEDYQRKRREVYPEGGELPDVDRFAGLLANPIPIKTGALAARLSGSSALSKLFGAGVSGAVVGSEQPVPVNPDKDFWEQKQEQAETGAKLGLGMQALGGAISPWMTGDARRLMEQWGIRVPFLSSTGRFGGRVEQISQSVPLSGMAVRGTYETANKDLVRAATNDTLEPLQEFGFGTRYTDKSGIEPGREMAAERIKHIQNSYEDVIPRLDGVADQELTREIEAIRAGLPSRVQHDFDDAVNRNLFSKAEAPKQPAGSKFGTEEQGRELTPEEFWRARTGFGEGAEAPAAATSATQAKPATVRFYHKGEEPGSGGGRWATPDLEYAQNFRGAEGNVHYVDVPVGHEAEQAARMWDEADVAGGTNAVGRYRQTELPEELAKKMQPLGTGPEPLRFEPMGEPTAFGQAYGIYRGKTLVGTTTSKEAVQDFNALHALPEEELPQGAAPRSMAESTGVPKAQLNSLGVSQHAANLKAAGTDLGEFNDAVAQMRGDKGIKMPELRQIYRDYVSGGKGAGRMTKAEIYEALKQRFTEKNLQSGPRISGQDVKYADMDLRDEAIRRIQNPANTDDRYLGEALGEVRAAFRRMLDRYSSPRDMAQLRATDEAYARHKILERAGTSSASPEGIFGPTQLWQAVKAQDASLGKAAIDQGRGRLQDLAETSRNVLGKTVADSGTPERAAFMSMAEHLGGAATGLGALSGVVSPQAMLALGGHAAAYSPPGQAALRALAGGLEGPRTGIAGFLRSMSPGAAALSAAQQPYDNKPRSVREWREEAAKRQQAGEAARQYYGQ